MWHPFRRPLHHELRILTARLNARCALRAHANPELNGFAAYLAILDVFLMARRKVDDDLNRLTAVRTLRARRFRGIHSGYLTPSG